MKIEHVSFIAQSEQEWAETQKAIRELSELMRQAYERRMKEIDDSVIKAFKKKKTRPD